MHTISSLDLFSVFPLPHNRQAIVQLLSWFRTSSVFCRMLRPICRRPASTLLHSYFTHPDSILLKHQLLFYHEQLISNAFLATFHVFDNHLAVPRFVVHEVRNIRCFTDVLFAYVLGLDHGELSLTFKTVISPRLCLSFSTRYLSASTLLSNCRPSTQTFLAWNLFISHLSCVSFFVVFPLCTL